MFQQPVKRVPLAYSPITNLSAAFTIRKNSPLLESLPPLDTLPILEALPSLDKLPSLELLSSIEPPATPLSPSNVSSG